MSQIPEMPQGSAGPEFFSSLAAETRFYIVRHGQSEGNARRIVQGRKDFPLDETGRAQAAALAPWLASQGIERVLSSPLARAVETARILAGQAGLAEPETDGRFMELDTGVFSGLSLDEAAQLHPESYAGFERSSWDGVAGAESSAELYSRALEAWALLRARALEGRTALALVSHGGFIQWLVRASFGVRTWMPLLPTGNCGVFELVVTPIKSGGPAQLLWKRMNFQISTGQAFQAQVF